MAEMVAPISLDGVAVHLDCWCICLCYLHFAPENPEDGKMHLLVPAHPVVMDKVQRAVKWLCVCVCDEEFLVNPPLKYTQSSTSTKLLTV